MRQWNKLAGYVVLVIALSACVSDPSSVANVEKASSSPTPSSSPVIYQSLLIDAATITTSEICSSYKLLLTQFETRGKSLMSKAKGKDSDPYKAQSFARYNQWIETRQTQDFDIALSEAANVGLNQVSGGRAGEVTSIDPYTTDSLARCALDTTFSRTRALLLEVDSLASSISTAASNVPWYPQGFEEYDSDVAYKWTTKSRSADCTRCIFWTMQVIANTGCPNGVYGELNILRNGEVVAWTNDSVPYLGPGQKAFLQFTNYSLSGSGGSYQGQLTELNCR